MPRIPTIVALWEEGLLSHQAHEPVDTLVAHLMTLPPKLWCHATNPENGKVLVHAVNYAHQLQVEGRLPHRPIVPAGL